jgi:ATP-dependent DNA ligase
VHTEFDELVLGEVAPQSSYTASSIESSSRYPGGMALRFARVLRYRDDKSPAEADTIDTVRALYQRGG